MSDTFYGPCKDIVIEGTPTITYKDIYGGDTNGRADISDKLTFLIDMLINNGDVNRWATLACDIFNSEEKSRSDHAENGWEKDFGIKGHYMDVQKLLSDTTPRSTAEEHDDGYLSSGLKIANSLKEVNDAAANSIAAAMHHKMSGKDYEKYHTIDPLVNNPTCDDDTVIYFLATHKDRHGKTYKYTYNCFGIAFYDLQLSVVVDDKPFNMATGNMDYDQAIAKNAESPIPGFDYSGVPDPSVFKYENPSLNNVEYGVTKGKRVSETSSNTITNTEEYSYDETVGFDVSIGQKFKIFHYDTSLTCKFTTEQLIATAYSETNSKTDASNGQTTINTTVPPHTACLAQTTISNVNVATEYDSPVTLKYKVAIFSMCGNCYDDNAATRDLNSYEHRNFVAMFGDDTTPAHTNLYNRAVLNPNNELYDKTHGVTQGTIYNSNRTPWADHLNWENIHNEIYGDFDAMIKTMTQELPLSTTGATLTQIISSNEATSELIPLYPLRKIYTQSIIPEALSPGQNLNLSNLVLIGENEYNVAYYSFSGKSGTWKALKDDDTNTNIDKSIAEIIYDHSSDTYILCAYTNGVVKVKYFIDENTYKSLEQDEYTKNSDLAGTVDFNVVIS